MANFYGSYIGYGSGAGGPGYLHAGENYCYTYGAYPPVADRSLGIEKVSMASGTESGSDVGDLTQSRDTWSGSTTKTHGFCFGGYNNGGTYNRIDRFDFVAEGTCGDVGDLSTTRRSMGSSSSETHGYCHGGGVDPGNTFVNIIERFEFSASVTIDDVGDLSEVRKNGGGHSDVVGNYGFSNGGNVSGSSTHAVDRYAWATSAAGVDVGDMTLSKEGAATPSSVTHGYTMGFGEASINNYITKYNYSDAITGTDVGDLTQARFKCTGNTHTDYGYSLGGMYPHGGTSVNNIERVSFAAGTQNGVDVGDLSVIAGYLGPVGSHW